MLMEEVKTFCALRHFDKLSAGVAQCDNFFLIVSFLCLIVVFSKVAIKYSDVSLSLSKTFCALRQAQCDNIFLIVFVVNGYFFFLRLQLNIAMSV